MDFDIRPWCTFFFISSSPTFFLPSLFCSASWNKGAGQAYQGEMGRLVERGTEVRSARTRVGLCPSHLPQWLALEEREGEDVLSEKPWIGLMPGSVVLFSLIKGETKEGDDLPHTSPPPAELFNRRVPPSRSGLSPGNPSGFSVLVFVLTDPLTRSRIFLVCLKSIINYLRILYSVSPHLLLTPPQLIPIPVSPTFMSPSSFSSSSTAV